MRSQDVGPHPIVGRKIRNLPRRQGLQVHTAEGCEVPQRAGGDRRRREVLVGAVGAARATISVKDTCILFIRVSSCNRSSSMRCGPRNSRDGLPRMKQRVEGYLNAADRPCSTTITRSTRRPRGKRPHTSPGARSGIGATRTSHSIDRTSWRATSTSMYQLTEDQSYLDRSRKLYTFFRRNIERTPSDAYIWEYEPMRWVRGHSAPRHVTTFRTPHMRFNRSSRHAGTSLSSRRGISRASHGRS